MKNSSRRTKPVAKAAKEVPKKKPVRGSSVSEVIYRVKTKRDSKVLLAFITFNYRVFHPAVTTRLLFYGVLIFVPGFLVKALWARMIFFVLGALVILLGLFRQYISLALTKGHDADYKTGTDFIYEFTSNDIAFQKDDEFVDFAKYKDLTGFFYDDKFYYMIIKKNDLHILPKDRFTKGDAVSFEDYIYKKSHKTCQWIPNKFKDKLIKYRAMRQLNKNDQ